MIHKTLPYPKLLRWIINPQGPLIDKMASSTSSLLSTTHRPTASNTTASTTVEPFAITTAFPVPSDCADSFTPTTADSWEWNWGRKPASTRIHITAYIPVPLELRESSCFPAGYENRTALQFSPGVCPGGWTAYDMATLRFEDITTAQCCPRYHALFYS